MSLEGLVRDAQVKCHGHATVLWKSRGLIWIRIVISVRLWQWKAILLSRLLRLRGRKDHHRDSVREDRDPIRLDLQRLELALVAFHRSITARPATVTRIPLCFGIAVVFLTGGASRVASWSYWGSTIGRFFLISVTSVHWTGTVMPSATPLTGIKVVALCCTNIRADAAVVAST